MMIAVLESFFKNIIIEHVWCWKLDINQSITKLSTSNIRICQRTLDEYMTNEAGIKIPGSDSAGRALGEIIK